MRDNLTNRWAGRGEERQGTDALSAMHTETSEKSACVTQPASMNVIGLTGSPQHGKSTVALLLRQQVGEDHSADLEYSDLMIAVANVWLQTLPDDLRKPSCISDPLHRANKWIDALAPVLEQTTGKYINVRPLLIRPDNQASKALHTPLIEYVTLSNPPETITRKNKIQHRSLLQWLGARIRLLVDEGIWSDLMEREIAKLNAMGYRLVTIGGIRSKRETAPIHYRNGIVVKVTRGQPESNSDLAEIANVPYDVELRNDGSLDDLRAKVAALWRHLSAGDITSDAESPSFSSSHPSNMMYRIQQFVPRNCTCLQDSANSDEQSETIRGGERYDED
jgi:hypothetical protein